VAILGLAHPLPKHPEKVLPIFNLDEKQSTEDHVKQFIMNIRLSSVRHEDVVCRLFPYTFTCKTSTWYFSLSQGSIRSWTDFQTIFLNKFGDDKTPAVLVLELSRIKMDPKEKIKEFNQRFLTLRNKIPTTARPTEEVTLEFYTLALPLSVAMFVKREKLTTLEETFEEAILVEKEMTSLKTNPTNESNIASSSKKKNENPNKNSNDKKEQDNFDMENLQRVIKKFSNDLIDIKKNNT